MRHYDGVSNVEELEETLEPDRLPEPSALALRQGSAMAITRAVDRNQPICAVLKGKKNFLGETAASVQNDDGTPRDIATFQDVDLSGVELKNFTSTNNGVLRFHLPQT